MNGYFCKGVGGYEHPSKVAGTFRNICDALAMDLYRDKLITKSQFTEAIFL